MFGAQVADFIEENGAAVRLLETPDAPRVGSGKGAALVAEEFALQQRLGDRGAIHGDERFFRAVAVLVDRAGDEFLAGAGLAADEHAHGLRRDAADLFINLLHRAALTDDRVSRSRGAAERDGRKHHAAAGDRLLHEAQQLGDLEGLHEIVVSAELRRLDRRVGRAVRGHQDHRQARLRGVQAPKHFQSARAGQSEIGDDEVAVFLRGTRQSQFAGFGEEDFPALGFEHAAQFAGDAGVVLDEQNRGGLHGVLSTGNTMRKTVPRLPSV